jgi:adenylate kinase
VRAGSEIGLRAQAIMDRGELVSDVVMVGIVRERLDRPDVADGFVLDGFPRTVAQASALDAIMRGRPPLVVVDIEVPEAELVRRLADRLVCEACGRNADSANLARAAADGRAPRCGWCGGRLRQRSDDSDDVVGERLRVYRRDTQPLVDYYRARPTFRAIDGAQPPDRVAAALAEAVESMTHGREGGVADMGAAR